MRTFGTHARKRDDPRYGGRRGEGNRAYYESRIALHSTESYRSGRVSLYRCKIH